MKEFNVYGIGNAIIDLLLHVEEDEFQALGLERGSMRLVDTPEQERLLQSFGDRKLSRASGGSAANSIIAIAQLKGRAAYSAIVGDDGLGDFYREEMEVLGVRLHNAPLAGQPTGTSVILITPDAERTMNTHLGATAQFAPEHVSEELIAKSEWLYVEGYLFTSPNGQEAVRKAITAAKRFGTKVAVTFSDGFIIDVFGDHLRAAVQDADLVFANINEAKKFTGKESEKEAFETLCRTVSNVAMTRSAEGAWVRFGGETYDISPFRVKATDDTGAGDMFAGAFLYAISSGWNGAEAGKLGCFLASRVVSQLGARLREDMHSLLQKEGFKS